MQTRCEVGRHLLPRNMPKKLSDRRAKLLPTLRAVGAERGTTLRAAELELTEARDNYLELYDFAPVGYLTLDAQRIIRQANLTAATLLGVERPTLIGRRLDCFVPPAARDALHQYLQAVLASAGNHACVLNLLRPDGAAFFARLESASCTARREDGARYRVVLTDVSAWQETQVALGESQQRLALAAHVARIGMSQWDLRTGKGLWTAQQEIIFGYAPTATATTMSTRDYRDWADRVHPDDLPRVKEQLHEAQTEHQPYEAEYRVVWSDGAIRWVTVRGQFCYDENGESTQLLAVTMDITERRRTQEKLEWLTRSLEERVVQRTRAMQMLHDIASLANQSQNAQRAIERCLHMLVTYNGWSFGQALLPAADNPAQLMPTYFCSHEDSERIRRFREVTIGKHCYHGHCLAGRVFASGRPEWITDVRSDLLDCRAGLAEEAGIGTAVAFPILVGEKVAGVLEFFADRVIPPDQWISDAMLGVGMQLGRVIERAQFEEYLLSVAEDIQRRIAQDLHDDVGQELTGLELKAETLVEMLSATAHPAGRLAADVAVAVQRTRRKVRGLSRGLLPVELEEGLLVDALGRLAAGATPGAPIACTFFCSHPNPVFDNRVATHLYRIAQEAVSNALRHSGAKNIRIALDQEQGQAVLSIEDDGRGLPASAPQAAGMGLRTMRYRAGLIGGKLEMGPGPRGGIQIVCRFSNREGELPRQ
jgi:PAS domain S-box-containing protein